MEENDNHKSKDKCMFDTMKLSNSKDTVNIVKNWYQSVYFWNIANYQSSSLLQENNRINNLSVTNINSPATSIPTVLNRVNHANQESNQPPQADTLEFYKVPTLIKRLLAETFDAIYIQIFKFTILFYIINYTNLIGDDITNISDFINNLIDEDNFMVSFEFLGLEVLYISISFLFESFCLYKYGYTPGKWLFGLKVISCVQINDQPNSMVQVLPGSKLPLKSVLLRTVLKNFSVIFLFPTILLFLAPAFMEYGQTSYDKAAESLVVENV